MKDFEEVQSLNAEDMAANDRPHKAANRKRGNEPIKGIGSHRDNVPGSLTSPSLSKQSDTFADYAKTEKGSRGQRKTLPKPNIEEKPSKKKQPKETHAKPEAIEKVVPTLSQIPPVLSQASSPHKFRSKKEQREHTEILIEDKKDESKTNEQHTKKKLMTKILQIKAKHKKMWVTREIAESLGREYLLMSTLRDTLFFIVFLIFVTTINLGVIEPETYHLFGLMEEELLSKNDFYNVHTPDEFWKFLVKFFDRSFYWDYWYYPDNQLFRTNEYDRSIFYENKLIGVPRIRQLRVRGDSCVIHKYFKHTFRNCFGKFNSFNEDTSSFGPNKGTAWKFTEEGSLDDTRHWGRFAWYHGGGYYQDLSLDRNETLSIIKDLMNNLWVTRHTRVVLLDWTLYNINLNLFLHFRLAFEFPRSGGIVPMHNTHICSLIRCVNVYDFCILACEMVCIVFLLWYTIEEVREMFYFRFAYLKRFWSWVDLIVLSFGYFAIAIRINTEIEIRRKLPSLLADPNQHSNMASLMLMMTYYKLILAWQLFFVYMKIFKYLNFNKSMAQLSKTLIRCRKDMFGFGIMFFVIFIAFAILGYIIFGTEVETFSTFFIAMFTLLRTILGDFDYTDIERSNRVIAPIFFLLFIFLVFFVLLNMFLAIINDTYVDVKTELAIAPEELQMTGFVKRGYYNLLIKMGCLKKLKEEEFEKNEFKMTTNEIKGALRRVGFTDLEVEMFLSRYNIDEEAKIKDLNVDKLLQILEGKHPDGPKHGDELDDHLTLTDESKKQQRQLQEIEDTLNEITTQLKLLLTHLENMENVRKITLTDVKGIEYFDKLQNERKGMSAEPKTQPPSS